MLGKRGDSIFDRKRMALMCLAIGLLVLWSILASALFAPTPISERAILGWSLMGFVVVASLARPFRGAGAIATALAVVVFFGVRFDQVLGAILLGADQNYVLSELIYVICFAVAGLLSAFVSGRLFNVEAQFEQLNRLIRELTVRDTLTGALKSVYGDKALLDEIERSRRFGRSVSLVLLDADDWSAVVRERGQDGANEVLKTAGKLLLETVRNVDTVVRCADSRFALILPETKVEGSQVVAERLCRALTEETAIQFRAGVAEFPRDAVSKDDLCSEADAALRFARTAGVRVASRNVLT